jgi:hypothetical protein
MAPDLERRSDQEHRQHCREQRHELEIRRGRKKRDEGRTHEVSGVTTRESSVEQKREIQKKRNRNRLRKKRFQMDSCDRRQQAPHCGEYKRRRTRQPRATAETNERKADEKRGQQNGRLERSLHAKRKHSCKKSLEDRLSDANAHVRLGNHG